MYPWVEEKGAVDLEPKIFIRKDGQEFYRIVVPKCNTRSGGVDLKTLKTVLSSFEYMLQKTVQQSASTAGF